MTDKVINLEDFRNSKGVPKNMSLEDFKILEKHLCKFTKPVICPVCDDNSWNVCGPQNQVAGDVPIVLLYCNICYFLYSFAWLPLLEKARSDE